MNTIIKTILSCFVIAAFSVIGCAGGYPGAGRATSHGPSVDSHASTGAPVPATTAGNDAPAIVDSSMEETAADAESPVEVGDDSPGQFKGTAGITEKKKGNIAPVVLSNVRTARHRGFDRIVFEFRGTTLPGYHLEYVDRPVRQCGSGNAVSLAGQGWLRVRLTPAQAHTDAGRATVTSRERRFRFPMLKELKSTCDFEAEVEWVLGLASPNPYRVTELSRPARLVVDIKHR